MTEFEQQYSQMSPAEELEAMGAIRARANSKIPPVAATLDTGAPRLQIAEARPKIITPKQPSKTKLATTKKADWITFAQVKPRELRWLWPGKIPLGLLTIFAGDPSLGKSLMTLECMARGSRGENFLDGTVNNTGAFETILLSAEDDPATIIAPRLMAANADLSKIHFVETVKMVNAEEDLEDERLLTLDSDLGIIREKLAANPAIKLLVIDPMSNYLGAADLNREQEVRSVLIPMIHLAQEFGVAIVSIAHHSKQNGRNAMHKVIGAVGAVGAGRMGWSFVKSPDDESTREMLLMKENLGKFPGIRYTTESVEVILDGKKTQQARIKFLCESSMPIENVIAAADDQDERRNKPARAFLKQHLPRDGEIHSNILLEKAKSEGISKTKLFATRKELGIRTEKRGGVWWWSWPMESDDGV